MRLDEIIKDVILRKQEILKPNSGVLQCLEVKEMKGNQ